MKKKNLLGVTVFVLVTVLAIQGFILKTNSLSVYANEKEATGRCHERHMADCFSASGSIWIGYVWKNDIETLE